MNLLPVATLPSGLLESQKGRSSVGSTGLFWPFQLYFETLHSNLETIHGLDRGLSAIGIIKADKSYMIGGKIIISYFFQFLCNMQYAILWNNNIMYVVQSRLVCTFCKYWSPDIKSNLSLASGKYWSTNFWIS